VLFLLFVGYLVLRAAIDDEAKGGRAAAILALVGLVNLPIIEFSVEWWNSLHQGESIFRAGGPAIATVFLIPLGLMGLGYMFAFGALWMERTRAEVWRRRALASAVQAAGA
jgi:heme exporter protein C